MFKIPITSALYGSVNFSLEGSVYTFTYRFNRRSNNWYIDISDQDGVILEGVKVRNQGSIFSNYSSDRLPSGIIFLLQTNQNSILTENNFGIGKEFELIYLSPTELG